MGIFDIIGPVMIGPSSSHTAGAARIGKIAREILNDEPVSAEITLYGSFATTGKGHGTDKALVAGLMGYAPDSGTIRDAITTAEERGLSVSFQASSLDMGHPNVAEIKMKGKSGRMATVVGRSLGGGRVMITEIDGFPVEITGEEYTLLTNHNDVPGIVADVGKILAEEHVNISNMRDFDEVWEKMKKTIPVFRQSIQRGLADTKKSASGLVGGDANTIFMRESRFLSPVCRRACAYAIATAEANAKMFRIVACPTAGSCGIVPAVLAAVAEEENSTLNDVTRALFTAGAIGRITAENASISGAVGGCQAECGTAAAMAAAAAVDLLHGTTEEMGNAMALAMKNILGLACDPVAGLVEVPCVKRNGFHAVHALVAVEMAMMGIRSVIPPDDVIDAMGRIGRLMPVSLRETSLAGLAMTEEGKHISERLMKQNAMPAE